MEIDLLDAAVLKAFEFHGKQARKFTNEPYVTHCLRVASLVGDYTEDEDLIIAAVLHDIIEDTDATVNDVNEWFGVKVAAIVNELSNDKNELKRLGKRDYILFKFNTLSSEGLIIKSIDRLDNVTGLINSKAPFNFIKNYVNDTDYVLEKIDRVLLPVHKVLLGNLEFINNYIALTILR